MSDRRVIVVAEIGNNHEGNFDLAERLIREAAACGADAVKFQTCRADLFITPSDPERLARFRSYEFTRDEWSSLARFARDCNVAFYSTPLDLESAALLEPLVDVFKVASGDLTFVPLLDYLAGTGKPVILSTGASEMREVNAAVERIRCAWRTQGVGARLAVLHCVSAYPAPADQANLDAIRTLSSELDDVVVGYSDHVTGIEACVAAAAVGAEIIEKHFTVDKAQSSFRDHALSADPAEFRELVQRIRAVEAMLGSGRKQVQAAEQGMASAIRRSISAARDLPKGHELNACDLIWLRPGTGIAPGNEARLIGRRLTLDVTRGHVFTEADLA